MPRLLTGYSPHSQRVTPVEIQDHLTKCPTCDEHTPSDGVWADCADCGLTVCLGCAEQHGTGRGTRILCPVCKDAYENCEQCGSFTTDCQDTEVGDPSVGSTDTPRLCGPCRRGETVCGCNTEDFPLCCGGCQGNEAYRELLKEAFASTRELMVERYGRLARVS